MSVLDNTGFLLNHGWKKISTAVWVDPITGKHFLSAEEAVQFAKKQYKRMVKALHKLEES